MLAQIREDPELADEVRRAVLTDALLSLPGIVTVLADRQAATEARMGELVDRIARVETQLFFLTEALNKLTGKVADMRGDLLELRYERNASAYFAPMLRRIKMLPRDRFTDLVEDARDEGRITVAEARDLLFADLVVEGLDGATRESRRLVVEVSGFIESHDVKRAARRAGLLARAAPETPVTAVVAGEGVEAASGALANEQGVSVVVDGSSMFDT